MSASKVLQIAGLVMAFVGVVSMVVRDRSTTSFVLGGLQVLAGLGMALAARAGERKAKG